MDSSGKKEAGVVKSASVEVFVKLSAGFRAAYNVSLYIWRQRQVIRVRKMRPKAGTQLSCNDVYVDRYGRRLGLE